MPSPNQTPPETECENVSLKTLVQYLFGYRSAILDLATNRATVWLGLIFVITAGLAREYDRENLAQEPWHLLAPLVASLATSWILFVMVYSVAIYRGAEMEGFWNCYRKFLGLYWMTAPLAWFYGIPVETFLPPRRSDQRQPLAAGVCFIVASDSDHASDRRPVQRMDRQCSSRRASVC